jgi:molybdopterin/thiamine biosynthesis adenylyltransferase/rhodanese-related sulfurtransferase
MGSLPPLVAPGAALGREQALRASRNLVLPGFGVDGQRRVAAARVLVIGAGGLGSPVLQYLAAAGIGTIGIVDFDTVDLSNLQRQVVHRSSAVGEPKTTSAARGIAELNPQVAVVEHPVRLDRDNALRILGGYDLVVDGSDNFATRYLANDAAAILRLPYVWGSVLQFDGQVTVFWEGAPDGRSIDYRDLHPVPPAPGEVLSCDEAGVLGAVCGMIGSAMATEAVKLVTGLGECLLGRVLTLDALGAEWREIPVSRRQGRMPVTELIDYELFCGVAPAPSGVGPEVGVADFLAGAVAGRRLLDVREPWEHDLVHLDDDALLPLARLLDVPGEAGAGPVLVYCKSGVRSARAAAALREAGVDAVSLSGGIHAVLDATGRSAERY